MQRWKKFSRNPLGRTKLIYANGSSRPRCVYCGRSLSGDFKITSNSSGCVRCGCGYTNYFQLIDEYLWEVTVRKTETNRR